MDSLFVATIVYIIGLVVLYAFSPSWVFPVMIFGAIALIIMATWGD